MSVEVIPVRGMPEVAPGDDLAQLLAQRLRDLRPREGDVVVVTQKIVSKAEGRVVAETDRASTIERETVRVVARRDDLVIVETRHGFVCANAGVDASNMAPGLLGLLPEDPDGSARSLSDALGRALGVPGLPVIVSDTFGRPWREGLLDVAIGVAGMPALVDLRGGRDRAGRELEATVLALADQIAAAAGAVMAKTAGIPAALVRGIEAPPGDGSGRDLVRAAADDLFRESPLQALHARRTIRAFGSGDVPRRALEEAIRAACAAPAPHHTRPWSFVVLASQPARRLFLNAIADAWREDLRGDGTTQDVIERRIARSDEVLGAAAILIVPFVRFDGAHPYPDAERAGAEREMFLLSGGAAIQNLLLALHAQAIASCWISSTLFCQEETRAVLGVAEDRYALGTVACGPMPEGGAVRPRPPTDLGDVLRWA